MYSSSKGVFTPYQDTCSYITICLCGVYTYLNKSISRTVDITICMHVNPTSVTYQHEALQIEEVEKRNSEIDLFGVLQLM